MLVILLYKATPLTRICAGAHTRAFPYGSTQFIDVTATQTHREATNIYIFLK
jgi:hypothetical protein